MIVKSRYVLAGIALLCSSVATAGITLGGTRIIYPQKSKETSILVKNDGDQDIMIQSWIEPDVAFKGEDVPFALTPALSRLGTGKQQTLRVFYYGQGLPDDKESVFWLSVQEIPQKAEGDNTLQLAMRQKIKVFYRPDSLTGTPVEAANSLKWRVQDESGKRYLRVTNDSLYHVSFGATNYKIDGKTYSVETEMVAPRSTEIFPVKGAPVGSVDNRSVVEFYNINDYGAPVKHTVSVFE
ncbi:P pilus assembly chaperone PapD [Pseudomonas fluorescens]|uniref:fimbrial biogenesis chaperone n=1 Tax=Pseudomonas fluorescens TaxID=294 RepID=UPI00209D1DD2|nr:molecular chaperone [Pseudomonas fluorescens]MCP1488443.1 P pilus assembly chaperone PapD [Pseudomonas fluorescens]